MTPDEFLCRDCYYFDHNIDASDENRWVETDFDCQVCRQDKAVLDLTKHSIEAASSGSGVTNERLKVAKKYIISLVILIILYTFGVYMWDVPTAAAMVAFWAALTAARTAAIQEVRDERR